MPQGQPTFLDSNPSKKSVCQTGSQKALAAKEVESVVVAAGTVLEPKEVAASNAEAVSAAPVSQGKEALVAPASEEKVVASSAVAAATAEKVSAVPESTGKEVSAFVAPASEEKVVAASTPEAVSAAPVSAGEE